MENNFDINFEKQLQQDTRRIFYNYVVHTIIKPAFVFGNLIIAIHYYRNISRCSGELVKVKVEFHRKP